MRRAVSPSVSDLPAFHANDGFHMAPRDRVDARNAAEAAGIAYAGFMAKAEEMTETETLVSLAP